MVCLATIGFGLVGFRVEVHSVILSFRGQGMEEKDKNKQPQYGSMHSGATRQGIGQKGIGIHATPLKYIIQYFSKKTSGEAGEQKKPP